MDNPDQAVLDDLHDRIQAAIDMHPPERWTAPECRVILEFFSELAVSAFRAEVDEVGQ